MGANIFFNSSEVPFVTYLTREHCSSAVNHMVEQHARPVRWWPIWPDEDVHQSHGKWIWGVLQQFGRDFEAKQLKRKTKLRCQCIVTRRNDVTLFKRCSHRSFFLWIKMAGNKLSKTLATVRINYPADSEMLIVFNLIKRSNLGQIDNRTVHGTRVLAGEASSDDVQLCVKAAAIAFDSCVTAN